jgi:hypothetical protein
MAAKRRYCSKHRGVELVTVTYCPACRGTEGGKAAAKRMTKAERQQRARKAGKASHAQRRTR